MALGYRVVTLSKFTQTFELEKDILAKAGAELVSFQGEDKEELIRVLQDADAFLVGRNKITEEIIKGLKKCKIIVRYGIGVDNIDIQAATRGNIIVSNIPDSSVDEVSTHTLALLLTWARKIMKSGEIAKEGKWGPRAIPLLAPLSRLRGQNLGILGFGRIGRAVAEKAYPFGFKILISDPYIAENTLDKNKFTLVDFETLLREADYITIHVPLTSQTERMIGEKEFKKMKPTVLLINTSRGGAIEEKALFEAISEGRIAGAALDVLAKEPPESENPLFKLENVLITPHSAWYTEDANIEIHRKAVEEVARVLRGEPVLYSLNHMGGK